MKNVAVLIITFLGLSVILELQGQYYYHNGQQVPLMPVNGKYFVKSAHGDSSTLAKKGYKVLSAGVQEDGMWGYVEQTTDAKTGIDAHFDYAVPMYTLENGQELGLSAYFYVKLKRSSDYALLQKQAQLAHVSIESQNEFMPLWYRLKCATGDALSSANKLHETGLFAYSEPDLAFTTMTEHCSLNDTYADDQWALGNTGQRDGTTSLDINYCVAKTISTGSPNITVAVFDQGLSWDEAGYFPGIHPDVSNLSPLSYDAQTGESPVSGEAYERHGIWCAGIIGAQHNEIGVAGIAPDCPLMDIKHSLLLAPGINEKLANGMNWAWQHGADVISCSWHSLELHIIADAIDNALTLGRDGKGCVLCFAAGNQNESEVAFPARYHQDILAVAAMNRCGQRGATLLADPNSCDPWIGRIEAGSNTGAQIDIAAPTNVKTTDFRRSLDNAYTTFGGTSAATPHVAGVAALLLSVNPNLTVKQVADIIERTAQKYGDYPYQANPNRANGTWNEVFGYGLLDAEAALFETINCQNLLIENTSYSSNTTHQACTIELKNSDVSNDAHLELNVLNNVLISEDFSVDLGATLDISTGGE